MNDVDAGAGGGGEVKNDTTSSTGASTASAFGTTTSSVGGGQAESQQCLHAQERVAECGIHLSNDPDQEEGGLLGGNLLGLELLDPELADVEGDCGFVARCASNCILESTCQELASAVLGLPTNYVSCIEYCLQLQVGLGGDDVVSTETSGSGGGTHDGNLDLGAGGAALPDPNDTKPGAGGAIDVGGDPLDIGVGGGNPLDLGKIGL